MNKVDYEILAINKVICNNIEIFDLHDRGLLSQNILSQLRNFIEHISLKIYSNGKDIENTYENIVKANAYIKTRGDLTFLKKFHKLLQITASHYTADEDNSVRLMLKYCEYLLRIKTFLKDTYDFDVLDNISKFPIKTDPVLQDYYEKIVEKINQPESARTKNTYDDRYYIQKTKPFFIGCQVYYEVTFTTANDKASKFDRVIAFTKLDISQNYAVKLSISNDNIQIMGKKMPIHIIDGWIVSIRPCELNHFADIFGKHSKIQSGYIEYRELMNFLTAYNLNLVETIDFADNYYQAFTSQITQKAKTAHFFGALDKSRELIKNGRQGSNVVRYLLYKLNNKIIKQQYEHEECEKLSNLYLKYGCIPFDQMPLNSSLINHNPKSTDLLDCIDSTNREHEVFASFIRNNTEAKSRLYTPQKEITGFGNIDSLIRLYNETLYYKHTDRRLENYKDHIYIRGYEKDTLQIIKKLKDLSSRGVKNYSNSVNAWLQSLTYQIDCPEKKEALKKMFENSKVALVYGSAGTGKSTMINYISNFFNNENKLYLANTNPAVDNLRRKVNAANRTFKTIAKFLSEQNSDTDFDILIIDECSTVSNSDMRKVLEKASYKLLVLVGDDFQIESILFGNWFHIAKTFVPKYSIFELIKPYRSNNTHLLTLWDKVRNIDEDILEHITKHKYSLILDESIFERSGEDEIILCLNYDGLYGINNINKFLQENNENSPVHWGVQTYKVNDPILFNESERFAPLIYNNLKGKIVDIKILNEQIRFDIELDDKVINQLDAERYDLQLMPNSEKNKSVIRIFVSKHRSTDEDDDSTLDTIVPFQIAYAVSIHKAQGLEYNSVKIVITDEIEEMISHNIFYTAITRAREKLKIYWTPETEKKVLSGLEKRNNGKDAALLSLKYHLK